MAKTHVLQCLHPDCDEVITVAAGEGDHPTTCQKCRQVGHWQIARVMIFSLKDLAFLQSLHISSE